jgi:ppGpp synthetase/RelA/SpoT-type nucleotidyltranferase
MSEKKELSAFEMQMQINDLLGQRLDVTHKWVSELTEVVKTLAARVVALEQQGCACKKGEM